MKRLWAADHPFNVNTTFEHNSNLAKNNCASPCNDTLSVNIETQKKSEPTKLRKRMRESPEGQLRYGLDMCSKRGDFLGAISLYDNAMLGGVKFDQHNYNVLLYICSSAAMGALTPAKGRTRKISSTTELNLHPSIKTDEKITQITEKVKELALNRGFQIYEQMCSEKIPLNEATFTSVARLAVAKGGGDLAFEIVKQMPSYGIAPRLRSYSSVLFAFCKNMEVEKAYEVDEHMKAFGVEAEEPELQSLLKLSAEAGREEKVYCLLHRLRASVRQISPSTANVIEQWFKGKVAAKVGATGWNIETIRKATESRGGGWHGQGWLNKGRWKIEHTSMTPTGVCRCCGEQLITIDIDPLETENFAKSIVALATQREVESNFIKFQEWLDDHGPYEAIIDGANVGLYRKNSAPSLFFSQLNAVVNGLRERSPSKKWPLVVMHHKRTREVPAIQSSNKQLINEWIKVGALYTTPTGSNDDWYWLYATVKFKCLIITRDEMRDHIFATLGNDFFPKWKERHQVRFTFATHGPKFYMPPTYSIVIQESERGSWHIPIVGGDDIEISRKWLCVTRPVEFQGKRQCGQASQKRSQPDSKLSELEHTHGMVVCQSDVAFDGATVSDSNDDKAVCPDLSTLAAPIKAEVGRQKSRSSLSSQYGSKKNRRGHNLPPSPSSLPASVTLTKLESAEKNIDFSIDFQI
ncbi:hypothetical protein KI387_011757 [Taxus chinensis]|uniref:ribonuclease P n=1 Tax=Taxus chinensis TaxID=29808 RepID=A0AA38FBM3_TAXCH|nr:hypothetical protein KI387_011757 [Taxus chinensis]